MKEEAEDAMEVDQGEKEGKEEKEISDQVRGQNEEQCERKGDLSIQIRDEGT